MPMVNCLVDDMLLQARPCSSLAPLQISNVEYRNAVDRLLHDAPDFNSQLELGRDYSMASGLGQLSAVSRIFDDVLYAVKIRCQFLQGTERT